MKVRPTALGPLLARLGHRSIGLGSVYAWVQLAPASVEPAPAERGLGDPNRDEDRSAG
jgi:hypothetical protein